MDKNSLLLKSIPFLHLTSNHISLHGSAMDNSLFLLDYALSSLVEASLPPWDYNGQEPLING